MYLCRIEFHSCCRSKVCILHFHPLIQKWLMRCDEMSQNPPKFSEFCFCLWVPHHHPPPLSGATAEVKQGSRSVLGWGLHSSSKGPISFLTSSHLHSGSTYPSFSRDWSPPRKSLGSGLILLYVLNILVIAPLLTSLVALSG